MQLSLFDVNFLDTSILGEDDKELENILFQVLD
jgi:hypothetical protein